MKTNNIIMGVLVAVIAVMGVAFAAFSTTLTIEGTASISSNWDIEYTTPAACTATSKDAGNRASTGEIEVNDAGKVIMTADFATPGDTVTCTVLVTNKSTGLSARRTGWALTSGISNSDAYSVNVTASTVENTEIAPNGTDTLTITVTYNDTVTATPDAEAKFTAQATYAQYGV